MMQINAAICPAWTGPLHHAAPIPRWVNHAHFFALKDTYQIDVQVDALNVYARSVKANNRKPAMTSSTSSRRLDVHHSAAGVSDRVALGITRSLRFLADTFFAKRYGNRAIVLETVAAVPGMVGGMLVHLRCLRWMVDDKGWIRTLLDEAENECMHLMTFVEIAKPNWFERLVVLLTQAIFFVFFFALYLASSRTAHRLVGYFEEEAVVSYTRYLKEIDEGRVENVAAPALAIDYWKLPHDARLRDVVLAVRLDEAGHRDVNHEFADALSTRAVAHAAHD